MQGDKIAETSGKVTSQRVLPNPGGGPKMESSFTASGKLLGVDETETGTYWAAVRPEAVHSLDASRFIGVSYRGAVYYQSSSSRRSRLNSVAGVFEYEVDAQRNTRAQIWEWK